MRPIEEVRETIFSVITRTPVESVDLGDAVGRVLAEDVVAPHDVPSFSNSAMDGFAVRAADVAAPGSVLEIVEDVPAGRNPSVVVEAGQATKIMTGAPMPDGADTVIRVEDTSEADGEVTIATAPGRGTSVRPPGGDVAAGTVVFTQGTRLSPTHIGVLATVGIVSPRVARRPRVAVMSTGDELVPADVADLPRGKIRDSNRPMLVEVVRDAGAVALDHGNVSDDPDELREILGRVSSEADAIVTSGGVSMGEYDVIKMVLRDEADVDFYPVAMKPGKPQGFGTVHGVPFFGLPGNPVSVFVSFEQFVRPALLQMQGASNLLRPRLTAMAGEDLESDPAKEEFVRVRFDGDEVPPRVVKTGGQGSHVLSGLANADAFAVLERGVERIESGKPVLLEMFRASESRRGAL